MNELFTQKYDNEEWDEDEYPWKQYRRKGYGFIYIKNPHYLVDDDVKGLNFFHCSINLDWIYADIAE